MNEIHLTLKKHWWDMIASGEKKEEYREIKPYWIRRLCYAYRTQDVTCKQSECEKCFKASLCNDGYMCYPFDEVVFHKGYTSETMRFSVVGVHYGQGKIEWGAPEGECVFIIKLGDRKQ